MDLLSDDQLWLKINKNQPICRNVSNTYNRRFNSSILNTEI